MGILKMLKELFLGSSERLCARCSAKCPKRSLKRGLCETCRSR